MVGYGVDVTGLGYGKVARSCNSGNELWVPKNTENYLTSWGNVSFSRRTFSI
jgi:hypothetical protein